MKINNDTVVLKMRPFTEKWQGFNGKSLVCLKIVFFCHKMATDYCFGALSHSERATLPLHYPNKMYLGLSRNWTTMAHNR